MKKERFFRYLGTSDSEVEQRCFIEGKAYVLVKKQDQNDLLLIDEEDDEHSIASKHFEEVTSVTDVETRAQKITRLEKELNELKQLQVGDIVVLSKAEYYSEYSNKICKIIKPREYEPIEGSVTVDIPHNSDGGFNVSLDRLRLATPDEIEEYNKPKLPKIGCQLGEDYGNFIHYGDKKLAKSTLRDMEKEGIISLVVKHDDGGTFNVTVDMLKQIYKVAKK